MSIVKGNIFHGVDARINEEAIMALHDETIQQSTRAEVSTTTTSGRTRRRWWLALVAALIVLGAGGWTLQKIVHAESRRCARHECYHHAINHRGDDPNGLRSDLCQCGNQRR